MVKSVQIPVPHSSGLNSGLVRLHFSQPITFGAVPTIRTDSLTPARGKVSGDLRGQRSFKGGRNVTIWAIQILASDSSVGRAPTRDSGGLVKNGSFFTFWNIEYNFQLRPKVNLSNIMNCFINVEKELADRIISLKITFTSILNQCKQ